jgi:hypothetical protein
MEMQDFMEEVRRMRKVRFDKSDQYNLGMLIDKMKEIIDNHKNDEKEKEVLVNYDFEYLFPRSFSSWRGSYDELALDFYEYDYKDIKPLTIQQFYKLCLDTVGQEFTGWKGGEYIMSRDTPIWIANSGHSGSTAIIDVLDKGYEVILISGYREF